METYISLIANSLIMIASSIIFACILLSKKKMHLTTRKVIVILCGIIIYSLIIYYFDGAIKTLCLCVLYVMLFNYLFKIEYYQSIFLTFLYIVLIIIPDLIILLFSIFILGIDSKIFYSEIAETVYATFLVNALLIILTLIFKKWLRKVNNIKLNNNKEIVFYVVITLACILIVFYNGFDDIQGLSRNILLSTLIMISFTVILYKLIKEKIVNNCIVKKYDKLLEFIKQYEIEIEEQKMLRHESKNQLITIKTKMLTESHEEIEKYINSLLNEHVVYKEEKYSKFQYLPANGLKGLFYYKAMEAEDRGIELSINVASKVEQSFLKKLPTDDFKQLGRLVGIYLDNAIEASAASEGKKLGIEIYMHNEDVIIIIENTYSGVIDIESIGKVRYTTKGKNHGYGLLMVKRILSEYKRFISERTITEKLYIQKLIIKKSIK